MSINYNFAFKNSNLQKWERKSPSNLLASNVSLKRKLIYIFQLLKNNPAIFYPPSFILISTLSIHIINIYPTKISSSLESDHLEYTKVSQKITTIESKIKEMQKHLNNIKVFYSQATPTYLFAFYLQNSIPQGVQLNDYSISDNGFEITASSPSIEPLNQMLTLILESPIVNKGSVSIKEISRNNTRSNSGSSINSTLILEVHGEILKLTLDKRELLYEESFAYGLSKKLLRFKTLDQLIRL